MAEVMVHITCDNDSIPLADELFILSSFNISVLELEVYGIGEFLDI